MANKKSAVALHIAIYHVSVDREKSAHPNATLKNNEYVDLIDILFRSVLIWHPEAKFSILTSPTTDLERISVPFNRVNSDVNHDDLMQERTRAQCDFVKHFDFRSPLALIDSDILLNAPLNRAFTRDFDIALTWRDNEKMPINGGVILINNRRPKVARDFFVQLYEIYTSNYAEESKWFGDQLALRDIVGLSSDQIKMSEEVEKNGTKFLLLRSDIYNFSPKHNATELLNRSQKKVFIHFKGTRKALMPLYWSAHLKPLMAAPRWQPRQWVTMKAAVARRRLQAMGRAGAAAEIKQAANTNQADDD